ncbi:hypothetical protein [Brevundimonas sp. GCM10030266]|uniref:hypothetical protein n=1 Tax=Brevundimonas sp. GCM10030266 TaxID=3273386 RepID=UPI0036072BEB
MTALARQCHRWLALIFTGAVLLNVGALVLQIDALWLGFVALIPLILMMITGLCLFVAPYMRRKD